MEQLEANSAMVAAMLKVLANQHRLMILCILIEGPETVGGLQQRVGKISQSALSQHLGLLKAHGLVDAEKKGQFITYHIADKRVLEVMTVLKTQYCT